MSNSKRRFHNNLLTDVLSFQVGKSWAQDRRENLGTVVAVVTCGTLREFYIYIETARVQTMTMCTSGVHVKTFSSTKCWWQLPMKSLTPGCRGMLQLIFPYLAHTPIPLHSMVPDKNITLGSDSTSYRAPRIYIYSVVFPTSKVPRPTRKAAVFVTGIMKHPDVSHQLKHIAQHHKLHMQRTIQKLS
jgi:hypothetical protein